MAFLSFGMLSANAQQPCCPQGTVPGPNLIANPSFELGTGGFTSELNLLSSCGNTSYSVENLATGKCTAGGWLALGPQAGNSYMVIDGPTQGNSNLNRVWGSSATVSANQTYSFEFWLRPTVTTSSNSNLRLRLMIGGVNVSGTIDPPNNSDWIRYCFKYTAPSFDVSVLIFLEQIINFGPSPFDYGIDNISMRECTTPAPPCKVTSKWKADLDKEACKVTFDNLSSAGTGSTILGYCWDFGDGQTSTEQYPCHFYENPGTYYACLTVYGVDEKGNCCTDTFCDKVKVDCEPEDCKLDVNISLGIPSSGCNYQLYASTWSNRPIVGYFWEFGDGTTGTGGPSVLHNFPGSGTYEVCVTVVAKDKDECCSIRKCRKIEIQCHGGGHDDGPGEGLIDPLPTDFVPELDRGSIKVFPNPASQNVNIEFNAKEAGEHQLTVTNLQGKVVLQKSGDNAAGTSNVELTTGHLSPGTYFVQVLVSGKLLTEKLIIQ